MYGVCSSVLPFFLVISGVSVCVCMFVFLSIFCFLFALLDFFWKV